MQLEGRAAPDASAFKINRLFNGTGYSPYTTTLIDFAISGVEPEELPMDSSTRKSGLGHHRQAGVCFGKRGEFLTAHLLPAGHIFTVEGQAIPVEREEDALDILAYLNTPLVRFSINKYCGQHKYSGYVNLLPFVRLSESSEARAMVSRAINASETARKYDEVQHLFEGVSSVRSFEDWADEVRLAVEAARQTAVDCEGYCERQLRELLAVSDEEALVIDRFRETQPPCEPAIEDADIDSGCRWIAAHSLVSFALGCVFGRWELREELKNTDFSLTRALEKFGPFPPAMRRAGPHLDAHERAILVYDPTHGDHIEDRLRDLLSVLFCGSLTENESHLASALQTDSLSEYVRRSDGLFGDHLRRYSKSRRKAPIYWQLATPSAAYSVWLYLHAFTNDTLYKVQNDYVAPKLAHEQRKLESLCRDVTETPKAVERKALAAQETFVDELRAFLEEVKRVAPLWNPNLDDGVIINFAPLWRLVPQHKPWQRELKAKCDELAAGKYDWARLAMHLWPERVVPKCATDRSLAIAHGLEEVFWVEGPDGKWQRGGRGRKAHVDTRIDRRRP
ncbi:MAG: BREX-1 system adenine-specific DNA-methyltransferase PglX [Pseudomonadota bacterium]|nr:BREX-1 system adenine-specific DNA-methyltransferase PglX [Pseudomonadota bacterium]